MISWVSPRDTSHNISWANTLPGSPLSKHLRFAGPPGTSGQCRSNELCSLNTMHQVSLFGVVGLFRGQQPITQQYTYNRFIEMIPQTGLNIPLGQWNVLATNNS